MKTKSPTLNFGLSLRYPFIILLGDKAPNSNRRTFITFYNFSIFRLSPHGPAVVACKDVVALARLKTHQIPYNRDSIISTNLWVDAVLNKIFLGLI